MTLRRILSALISIPLLYLFIEALGAWRVRLGAATVLAALPNRISPL